MKRSHRHRSTTNYVFKLPFGEEINAGTGARTSTQGYGSGDNIRQKFTGYERDTETDLDFAQARMYSSKLGRFTSCDSLLESGRPRLPQSWNRYSYVLNNSLKFNDPTGEKENEPGWKPDKDAKPETYTHIKVGIIRENGKDTGKRATVTLERQKGTLTTESGVTVTAYKATSEIKVEIFDSEGKLIETGGKELINEDFDNKTNCHGVTFANGEVWLPNDSVDKLTSKENGYRPLNEGESPSENDVGVFSSPGSKNEHSVKVVKSESSEIMVNSKSGIQPTKSNIPLRESWTRPKASVKFCRPIKP